MNNLRIFRFSKLHILKSSFNRGLNPIKIFKTYDFRDFILSQVKILSHIVGNYQKFCLKKIFYIYRIGVMFFTFTRINCSRRIFLRYCLFKSLNIAHFACVIFLQRITYLLYLTMRLDPFFPKSFLLLSLNMERLNCSDRFK